MNTNTTIQNETVINLLNELLLSDYTLSKNLLALVKVEACLLYTS